MADLLLRERTMRKESRLLVLAAAVLTAGAIAQEIVIEPTNGRAPSANHVSRPAAVESAPAAAPKSAKATQSANQAANKPAKVPVKQAATKPKASPVETKPSVSPVAETKGEVAEATPAPKKVPSRPEWAMSDTRDASSLQIEIASALAGDPKLAGSAIQVNVDDGAVTLEGRAAGSEERLQAQRLARSYAWNRKVVDHIEVVNSVSAQK
jgi:hypothetical protein